jgi:hypothetical protein
VSFAYVRIFALDLNYIQRYRSPELIKIAQIISATGAEAFYIGIPCISTDRQSAAKNKQLYHRAFFTFCLRFSSFSRLFCISVGGAFLVLLGRSPEHSTGNLQPAEGKTANFNAYFRLFFINSSQNIFYLPRPPVPPVKVFEIQHDWGILRLFRVVRPSSL